MSQYTILHTIETAGPGGAEMTFLDLASHLDPNRFRSLALIPEAGWLHERLRERGIPTVLAKSTAWHDRSMPKTMMRLVRSEKVDLIHSTLPGQNFYSCLVGRWTGRKTVVTYQSAFDFLGPRSRKQDLELGIVRHTASAVVGVTEHIRQLLIGRKFAAEKTVCIYNSVQPEKFETVGDGRVRKELGCTNGTKIVGMVANLRASKGYEFFIRAARKVSDVLPQTRFVSVGDPDEQIAKRLSKEVEDCGLRDRFFFLGFRKDVPEILQDLDVFVLSSVSEGLPLVMLEAMAAGKPVVVTRCGGPQEVIEDGRTGFLVPPADADALAAKICEVVSDSARAAALGRAAREKANSKFTQKKMVGDYQHLYERCLDGR
jgi:glycosyltransferase involved in cell wall biosynthesis